MKKELKQKKHNVLKPKQLMKHLLRKGNKIDEL
jgi:hypothetical protein